MDMSMVNKIKSNPKYKELMTSRNSLTWKLALLILFVYYLFILIIAFYPNILGFSIFGGVTTIGIPIGISIIIFSFILTGIYTKKANKRFDKLIDEIKKEMMEDDYK